MTENKRFNCTYYYDGTGSIYDKEKNEYYFDCDLDEIEEVLNELNDENKTLKTQLSEFDFLQNENQHMRTVINENMELKARIKELHNDLIDHSALIKMLEDAKALDIEDIIWNSRDYRTQTEFDDDFADYRENAKKRWRE